METKVHFTASGLRLEGRLHPGDARAVVVTHPHPLYGGNMHNPVVETIAAVFAKRGATTLRFNFRGVGASQGSYDDGRGEQEDLAQATAFLQNEGLGPVELSGYSFGTWVNALYAVHRNPDTAMTMVSPPVAFMDFRAVDRLPGLRLAVTGSRDDIAPPEALARIVPRWNPDAGLEVVPGADHFYGPHLDALARVLEGALREPATERPRST